MLGLMPHFTPLLDIFFSLGKMFLIKGGASKKYILIPQKN